MTERFRALTGSGLSDTDLPSPRDPQGLPDVPGEAPLEPPEPEPAEVPLESPRDPDRDAPLESPERTRPPENDDLPGREKPG